MPTAVAGPEIERLIQLLARLPGLGPRSARRAALHLIKKRELLMAPLATALETAMTAGDLHDALSRLGADLMLRALAAAERGSLTLTPQPDNGTTYAEKISKNETRIDWSKPWLCRSAGNSPSVA